MERRQEQAQLRRFYGKSQFDDNDLLGRGGYGSTETVPTDYDLDFGTDLKVEYSDTLPADSYALTELILDASESSDTEARAIGRAAEVLRDIVHEFHVDGEEFEIRDDATLRLWVTSILEREVPDLDELDRSKLIQSLEGFPPRVRHQNEYGLAA